MSINYSVEDEPRVLLEPPGEGQVTASFRESKISFAVDVSGSTYGPVLRAERRAIESVCSLIPRESHPSISIIPWNDNAHKPLSVATLSELRSSGGTDPNAFLDHPRCRIQLQESEFWFLMTDGIIENRLVHHFARNLTSYGMHGKACIISVFGEKLSRPADCRISVGLSVFAVSPHVAFLYTDVENDRTYVLSTKGCFTGLLQGKGETVILEDDTPWNDLPQISYEDLTRISDGVHINMPELLADANINENLIRQIMLNDDNMRTIANTAKVTGQADKLHSWLDQVENPFGHARADSSSTESDINQGNRIFLSKRETMKEMSSSKDYNKARSSFFGSIQLDKKDLKSNDQLYLSNSGFLRPSSSMPNFSSTCPECGKSDVLALILSYPPTSPVTENFPELGSLTKLIYPLTMGNYAETDVISDTIACDSCSAKMARRSETRSERSIAGVLPLVSYAKNQNAWIQTVGLATSRRFSRSDVSLVFLSIAATKKERLILNSSKRSTLYAALEWVIDMIQTELTVQDEKLDGVSSLGSGRLDEVILRNFRDSLDADKFPLLMSYPLDGFIVANAAISSSKFSRIFSKERQKTVVFLRFLFHLVENFVLYGEKNGAAQLQAEKTLLLLLDDPIGPRSLFRNSRRRMTFYLKAFGESQRSSSELSTLGQHKLSLTISDLIISPLLNAEMLQTFKRLGPLFSWIESQCGHAIAVFVHYLMRFDAGRDNSAEALFIKLRRIPEVKEALADPGALSARSVDRLIKGLPALE
ncbi:hypothetical protein F5Y03DRAFT_382199 [Xylaria venustula]|nr:hypothetical protein F5Y03DRAFT_382199 [Xylaria venustula]